VKWTALYNWSTFFVVLKSNLTHHRGPSVWHLSHVTLLEKCNLLYAFLAFVRYVATEALQQEISTYHILLVNIARNKLC
jgi:hypothetical protein